MIKTGINFSHDYIDLTHGLLHGIDPKNYYIAGGSIMKLANGMDLGSSDIDVFFKNFKTFKEASLCISSSNLVALVNLTDFAYTYEFAYKNGPIDIKFRIQLINERFANTVEDLLKSFDLNVCKYAIHDFNLYALEEAIEGFRNKTLKISNSKISHSTSLERVGKYISLGFKAEKDIFEYIIKRSINNNDLVFINSRQKSYFLSSIENNSKTKLKNNVFHTDLRWESEL